MVFLARLAGRVQRARLARMEMLDRRVLLDPTVPMAGTGTQERSDQMDLRYV